MGVFKRGWGMALSKERWAQLVYSLEQYFSRRAELSQNLLQWARIVVCVIGFSIGEVCHGQLIVGCLRNLPPVPARAVRDRASDRLVPEPTICLAISESGSDENDRPTPLPVSPEYRAAVHKDSDPVPQEMKTQTCVQTRRSVDSWILKPLAICVARLQLGFALRGCGRRSAW